MIRHIQIYHVRLLYSSPSDEQLVIECDMQMFLQNPRDCIKVGSGLDRIWEGYTYEIFDRNAPSTGEFVNGRNSSPPDTSVIHNFQVHSDL